MLNKISIVNEIPQQFPQVYREESPELVEFVKSYHEHLESTLQQDYFTITDIDTTYAEFLKYFQRTHLKDLDVELVPNVRLITKHIHDLYNRKGSEEGLRMLFKLFFNENIELFYPSVSLLTPSSSEYYNNSYLEMESVQNPFGYDLQRGMRIQGQTTGATAYVEEVVFKNFDGVLSPLVFLSNKRGEFTVDDVIIVLDDKEQFVRYSTQKIAGSMSEIVFDNINQSSPNNEVGDEFDVVTQDVLKKPGKYGRVMAEEVTTASTGSVSLNISERGYGYTVPVVQNSGILVDSIDAQNNDVVQIVFQPTDPQAPPPSTEQALIFENTIKYYRIQSAIPFPNVAGDITTDAYAIECLSGFSVDEGATVNIEITANPNIADGTTIDVELSGDIVPADIVGELLVYTVTITNGVGTLSFDIAEDNVADGIKQLYITLAEQDSASNFTGQPAVVISVNDTSTPDSPLIDTLPQTYLITLETPVEKNYLSGFAIDLVDKRTITDVYISNQVLVVDDDTAVRVTLLQIADEIDRIAVGLTTPSDPTNSDLVEIFNYLKQINSDTRRQNGDINNTGAITESDATYLRNAYYGDPSSIKLIGDRFDEWTKATFGRLESIDYFDGQTTKSGQIIAYERPLLYIATSQFKAFPAGDTQITIQRNNGQTFDVTEITEYNDTARFELQSLGEYKEQISIPTLPISDLFNTSIDTLFATTLGDLSPIETFEIGEVGDFKIIDSGFNYTNETFFAVDQPFFGTFNKHDFYVEIENLGVVLFPGDEISQVGTSFSGLPYTSKGVFLYRKGNRYYFRSKSFYQFNTDLPISIYNLQFEADSIIYDLETPILGQNAEVKSTTTYGKGQIQKVKILNCGYRYEDGSVVNLVNDDGVSVATATVRSLGTGFSEGQWRTTRSHLNAEARVLQDSNYYQEFSFDVNSVLTPDKYEKIVRDVVQVAGTKMFSTPLINTNNNLEVDGVFEIAFFEIKTIPYITENDAESPVEESQNRYPEQNFTTEDSPFRGDLPENLVTVETEATTTITI